MKTVENKIFRCIVTDVERLTPGMMRVTFGGEGLAEFESTGVGDEYVRVFFPKEGETEPVMPFASGRYWDYPEGVEAGPMRVYTVRGLGSRPGELVLDFVVHEGGVAAAWALRARVGDVVAVNSPTGLYEAPDGVEWQLLLADATGLPAAARLLEQAPEGVRTRAILEVAGPEDHQVIETTADVDLVWVHGGNGHAPSRLDELLRSMDLPSGVGYIWIAGEAKTLRAVRKYLRHELKLPADSYKIMGYWTDNAEEYREKYANLDEEFKAWLETVWDEDRDEEDIQDDVIAALEARGL